MHLQWDVEVEKSHTHSLPNERNKFDVTCERPNKYWFQTIFFSLLPYMQHNLIFVLMVFDDAARIAIEREKGRERNKRTLFKVHKISRI